MIVETQYTVGTLCGGTVDVYVPPGTPARQIDSGYICPCRYARYEVPDGTHVVYHDTGWQEESGGVHRTWDDRPPVPDWYVLVEAAARNEAEAHS